MYLSCIRANNSLAGLTFRPGQSWLLVDGFGLLLFLGLSSFVAAENSRSLSVSVLPGWPTEALVFFEAMYHTMTAMHGWSQAQTPSNTWIWRDLTDSIGRRRDNVTCGSPFGSDIYIAPDYVTAIEGASDLQLNSSLPVLSTICTTPDTAFAADTFDIVFDPCEFLGVIAKFIVAHNNQ